MADKAYISNISPAWTIEQHLVLMPAGVDVYRDEVKPRHRQAHQIASLEQRASILRPTNRRRAETIYVASLAVLAWGEPDFRAVLTAAGARGATIKALASDVEIAPGSDPDAAVAVWKASRNLDQRVAALKAGPAISAENRRSKSDKAIKEHVEPYWPLPSKEYPTAALVAASGLSLNTIKDRLGPRPIAQYKHQQNLKRAAARAKK